MPSTCSKPSMVVFDNCALQVDFETHYKIYDLTFSSLREYVERFNGIRHSEFDVLAKLERYARYEYGQMFGSARM